jgi:hypothetical protein
MGGSAGSSYMSGVLFTPASMTRILEAKPLRTVTNALTLWINDPEVVAATRLQRLLALYNAVADALNISDQPVQLDVFVPLAVNIPFTGTTYRYNVQQFSRATVRKPATVRITMTAAELTRPPGFPRPRN